MSPDRCCPSHRDDCCDPNDCGPCCLDCPTCPTLMHRRFGGPPICTCPWGIEGLTSLPPHQHIYRAFGTGYPSEPRFPVTERAMDGAARG